MGSLCSSMNEDEGKWFERREHPLLNDLILEKIFEHVRPRDLLTCRLVCQKWNVLTIPFTRSKLIVGIHFSYESLNNRNSEEGSTRRIQDFVPIFSKNTLGIPFAKFKLGPFCTPEGIGQPFLQLCADTTKEIHLSQYGVPFKVEEVSELLRSMKNLEKLTLSDKFVTDSRNVVELFPGSKPKLSSLKTLILESVTPKCFNPSCPSFLEELITAAENISDLTTVDCWHPYLSDNPNNNIHFNRFEVLNVVEKLGRESCVRRLSLRGFRMNQQVPILRRMAAKSNGLKLKELSLAMGDDAEEIDYFQLLEIFKDTLEDLQRLSSSCSSFRSFPKMSKLRRLYLEISRDFDSSLVNLDKIFPNLKELQLCQGGLGQVYDEFLPQSEPCPALKSLCLLPGLHLRINAFSHVLTIFPRLTELRIEVRVDGTEILRQIWSQMTQLEILSIWGKLRTTESTDSLFTGIQSIGAFQKISDVVKGLEKMSAKLRRKTISKLRNQYCHVSSIRNLRNLRCLELNVSGRGDRIRTSYLSDVSGFLGFHSLKQLSSLFVHECELTKTCCEILTMEVGLESWKFTTPEEDTIIPDSNY